MAFSDRRCLTARFVPILRTARKGVSKIQKKALENNAVRWELPKLGEGGCFHVFFCVHSSATGEARVSPDEGPELI